MTIGQYLPKLCSNKNGPVFLTHSDVYVKNILLFGWSIGFQTSA